jgi:thiamine-phosphate diphosphorylase
VSAPRTPQGIYLVLDADVCRSAGHAPHDVAAAALDAGIGAVQLRAKHDSTRSALDLTLRVADVTGGRVPLLVDDRTDVVLAARRRGARVDGVHLGQSDLPARDARDLLGPGALVGLSAATPSQVDAAHTDDAADHLGAGAFRSTATKSDAPLALGLGGLQRLVARAVLPVVAIGGLRVEDVRAVRRAGVAAIAVVSAICAAPDPGTAARALTSAWTHAARSVA